MSGRISGTLDRAATSRAPRRELVRQESRRPRPLLAPRLGRARPAARTVVVGLEPVHDQDVLVVSSPGLG